MHIKIYRLSILDNKELRKPPTCAPGRRCVFFNYVLCVSLIIKSARETGKNYDIVLTCEQT